MASPLLILFACSLVLGLLTTLIVIIVVSVDSWADVSYDVQKLAAINNTCSVQSCQIVTVLEHPLVYRYDSSSKEGNWSTYLYALQSGLWSICNSLPADWRSDILSRPRSNFAGKECFTFVTDYNEDEVDSMLTDETKQLSRLQNSAASCYIVVLIDLSAATVVGVISLARKQVASSMVTGVLYLMAALFGVFGLSMFHTRNYYEKTFCYALDKVPSPICKSRVISLGYAVALAWVGVLLCCLSSFLWLSVSKALRFIRSKSML
ncbi:hypothetical protein BgiMline_005327 [Biomphalaria glabrata]|uniref:Uncharacterized protein LOC106055709 n=1 Tax=Biomphalaria glabrata TaxID=6526 RepID=A0A9W2ZMH4_BIOGL|nr:uncharacterized protein LOC106055709 [Biomphalaria glabrata]XP_055876140.1 uncharacterized protein LOC106055709 [Biomphalaria glabrata]XP_055876141.1 uncharacterized protein LOC106055709 [Biomphalaria glabrata]XP_055876142.1 uncharacterized protein LOC106055709 [Biomphalaria glabrata]XP_055876143.1 uncharacterized protein LOC106055709 [Biomphalaria glabrata]XP_055876144.1 uncharacterized protein LOC106055709 [Biomphalaria glabrata]XP_055876145.1 uncharacterized protein LOC106055709 [Biomph